MASTRNVLERIKGQLDESMGVRVNDARPQLSPVPNAKDVGRRALRTFGTLAIDNIIPDPDQPRTEFDEEEIEQLAQSIRDKGQLHPIRVRWSETHGKWLIISGERRFRATKKAGLPTVDCHFQDGELSQTEVLEQQLIENLLRSDLRPIEQAKAFQQLITLNGWSGKELAEALRITPSKVARSLALLKLPQDIQVRIESSEISPTVAYEVSKLESEDQQRAGLAQGRSQPLTVAKASNTVRQRRGTVAPKTRGLKQVFLTEEGFRVTVTASKRGTYDEIEQALRIALEEVQTRIRSGLQLF